MTPSVMNMEHVVDHMQEPLTKYLDRVQTLAGANCLAVLGFGAIATSEFDPARHSARTVVVMDKVDLATLRELAKDGAKLGKARIAAPLIMTPVYINGSLDAFPLELLEIQQCHVCFVGTDYFADLAFDERHVRLQCERELKTILIGMRQGTPGRGRQGKTLRRHGGQRCRTVDPYPPRIAVASRPRRVRVGDGRGQSD